MYGKTAILLLTFVAFSSFHIGDPGLPLKGILRLYHRSDNLFRLSNSTPSNDSTALAGFEQIIREFSRRPHPPGTDTLLFQCYLKTGILLDSKYDFTGARDAYGKALLYHLQNDSLAFVTNVYAGTSYYNLNIFDSANYFLLKAESHAARFHDPEDQVRLYNTLGVMYYDNGNYQQANNYFNQALGIVKDKHPLDTVSAVSLQTNIATSCYRLGLYRESLTIYNQVLKYHIFADPIYMNMGMAYASLDKYPEAMACFRKVHVARIPGVLNEMGNTELHWHRPDSAAWFLDRLKTTAAAGGQKLNDLDLGINHLLRADLLAGRRQYLASLTSLQQAILIFSPNFTTESIFSNPSGFTGTFACYRLFDALFKKATVFESLYRLESKQEYLVASYEAYKAALSLLRYIEKSYDTDDAKIFLKKKNTEIYQQAVTVCLELYRLHPGNDYLEQAFMISEKNKGSVITANLELRDLDKIPGAEGDLLQKERNIKYNIARLNIKREATADKKEIEKIATEKAGYEIGLSRLQKELEQNDHYYRLKYNDSAAGIRTLQQHLDNHQALISFYGTADALHIFALTRSGFHYARVDSLAALQSDVEGWLTQLQAAGNGRKFRDNGIGARLSRRLIKPVQAMVPDKDEWIIVPDGFLCFLPFESLPADGGAKTLLETTTISYQFSSRLLTAPAGSSAMAPSVATVSASSPDVSGSPMRVLAFAPFAGIQDHSGQDSPSMRFNQLPASREEIAGLPGVQYIDSFATRQRFLQEIAKYPIVHLATHAVSAVTNASESFIAFYQQGPALQNCLFLEELYGLDMNATRLVIISACETGQGELVSKEGVISLARGFAYAGCASSISSLWKADDQATSYILRRFYTYLQQGYTKSKALRRAKLDYLGSDAINKSPAYWSHLMLIGNTERLYDEGGGWRAEWGKPLIKIFLAGMLMAFMAIFFWRVYQRRIKRKEKVDVSHGQGI